MLVSLLSNVWGPEEHGDVHIFVSPYENPHKKGKVRRIIPLPHPIYHKPFVVLLFELWLQRLTL